MPSARRLELLPYVAGASTVTSNRDPVNPFDNGANVTSQTGADLKMGIGHNLTLDATVNPDFGQVESDPAVVNLTAFETIFTEKRPFFAEGAGLLNLAAVNNFFYSRRIGARPTGPAPGDFVDYPRASRILGAAKLTGRLASGTSVGMLAAVTGDERASVFNRSSPGITKVAVTPRTDYAVARAQQEFGRDKSTVSGMVTVLHRSLSNGDPLAALLVRNAFAVASDSTLRFKGGQYEVTPYGGGTVIEGDPSAVARVQRSSSHYAQRPDRNYDTYDPTRDVNVDVYVEPFAASGHYSNLGELAVPATRKRLIYGTDGTTATPQPDGSVLVTDGNATFTVKNNNFNVHSFRSNVVMRWEYRPGSTLYLVWQQDRHTTDTIGDRVSLGDPFRSLTVPGTNYFVIKTSFWIPGR